MGCTSVWKNRSHACLCFGNAPGPPGLPAPGAAQSGVSALSPKKLHISSEIPLHYSLIFLTAVLSGVDFYFKGCF